MKAIYLTYDGLLDPLGQSQVLPYLLELSKSTKSTRVISFEKNTQNHKLLDATKLMLQNDVNLTPKITQKASKIDPKMTPQTDQNRSQK